jgi:hypothetical protein
MATAHTAELMAAVIHRAAEDAALFVEEFGEALDSAGTDWDAVAWGELVREMDPNREIDSAAIADLWDLYRGSLAFLTRKALEFPPDEARERLRDYMEAQARSLIEAPRPHPPRA